MSRKISNNDLNTLLHLAANNDENAVNALYKNYYHYVDSIVEFWPYEATKEKVRYLAEKELKDRIKDYFNNNCKSDMSNYLHVLKRDFKTRLSSYPNGLLYLMRELSEEKEELRALLTQSLMPIINGYLKENNLFHDVNAKICCLNILSDIILEHEKLYKTNSIEERLLSKLKKLKPRDIFSIKLDYDPNFDEEANTIREKYSYMINTFIDTYDYALGYDDLVIYFKDKYDFLIDRYLKTEIKSSISNYLHNGLRAYSKSLYGKENKIVKNYLKEGALMFDIWANTFLEEDYPVILDFYTNIIINYVKSGAYKKTELKDYLVNNMLKFNLEVAKKIENIKKTYADSDNVFVTKRMK